MGQPVDAGAPRVVEPLAVRDDRVHQTPRRARAVHFGAVHERDDVGDERQPRVEAHELALLAVVRDAPREERDADAREREALHQLEVAAREHAHGQELVAREQVDELAALLDAPREHERPRAEAGVRRLDRRRGAVGLARGHEHVDRVAEERHEHELGVRPRVHDEAEIDRAPEHGVAHALARAVPERHLDLGRRAEEIGHETRQKIRAEGLVAADDEAARVVVLEALDAVLRVVQQREDLFGVVQQHLTRARQLDAAAASQQQRRAEPLFEVRHGDRERRLADLERLRGRRHAAARGDALKIAQVRQVHGFEGAWAERGRGLGPCGPIDDGRAFTPRARPKKHEPRRGR